MSSTVKAGGLGRAFGNALVVIGVLSVFLAAAPGGLWLAAIGFFVALAAQAEVSFATTRTALAGLRVRDAMVAEPDCVEADATISDFVGGAFERTRHTVYPVASAGLPVGLLHYRDLARVPAGRWDRVPVREVTTPLDECLAVGGDDPLADALMDLAETPLHRALVFDGERLAGLLSITDVSRLLEVERLRMSGFPQSGSVVSTVSPRRVEA
jgi:CBS domain-containing protein